MRFIAREGAALLLAVVRAQLPGAQQPLAESTAAQYLRTAAREGAAEFGQAARGCSGFDRRHLGALFFDVLEAGVEDFFDAAEFRSPQFPHIVEAFIDPVEPLVNRSKADFHG